jgi:hypothetical protein
MRTQHLSTSLAAPFLIALACGACAPLPGDPGGGGGEVEQDILTPDGGTTHYGPINPLPRNLGVVSNYGGEKIELSVDCAGNADHQIVVRQTNGGGWTRLADTCPFGVLHAPIIDSTIQPVTPYCYHVEAENADHKAVTSDVCLVSDRYRVPPALPTVTLTASGTSMALVIVDNADNELGYRIYRKKSSGTDWGTAIKTFGASAGTGARLTFTDYGLDRDSSYDYKVEVYHQWMAASVLKTGLTIPNAPRNLRFSDVQAQQVTVDWDDTNANEAGYKIVYSAPGYATESRKVGRDVTTLTLYLTSGQTYHISVTAYDATGYSDPDEGDVTTPSQAPPPATAELQPHQVDLDPIFPHAGDTMVFKWQECNYGGAAAGSYRTVVKRNGTVVVNMTFSLAANTCLWRQTATLSGLPAGDLKFEVDMDVDQQISEGNESDNVNTSDFSVDP